MNSSYPQHIVVHPEAKIGENVTIGPFSYIDRDVVIGDNVWIGPNVTIFEGARIGNNVQIHPGAVISGTPQDLKFAGEVTTTEIGEGTIIREYVTINRGTNAAKKTVVGKNCLIMAYAHVAHDCILGDRVILANNVALAGHVEIEDWAILEALSAVQQFVRIGRHCFIAGGSLVRKSVPPYIRAAREPLSYVGVNKVGLTRRGFSPDDINLIHDIYRHLFVMNANLTQGREYVEQQMGDSELRSLILDFLDNTQKTGVIRGFIPATNGADGHDH